MEAVVEALKTHAASAAVQKHGFEAIFELCAHGTEYIFTFQNVRRAVEAGAVEVIVRALEGHAEDAELQIYGCKALWRICEGSDEGRRRAVDAGGLDAVTTVLKSCVDHHIFSIRPSVIREIHLFAVSALAYMCGNTEENWVRAETALGRSMRDHPIVVALGILTPEIKDEEDEMDRPIDSDSGTDSESESEEIGS